RLPFAAKLITFCQRPIPVRANESLAVRRIVRQALFKLWRQRAQARWLVWAAALACSVISGCGPKGEPPVMQPPIVTVAKPIELEVTETYHYEGYTSAVSTVDIRARVSGYLSKVYFKDGEIVKKDAPLFLIDPRPYQAALDQAR